MATHIVSAIEHGEENNAEQRGTYADDKDIFASILQILSHFSSYSDKVSIANVKHDISENKEKNS